MGLFGRKRAAGAASRDRQREAAEHLAGWMSVRRGIEVFVEPKTSVTASTMLLVAHDGEFTRRPISSPDEAKSFAREHGLPIYDATVVGYPQRMRDYSRRQTLLSRREDPNLDV
jgi:hypothetical protein